MSWESKVESLLGHCTSEAVFGGEFTHIPRVGPAQAFKGVWSESYLAVDPENGIQVMSSDPNVGVRLSDFRTKPGKGDAIIRKGIRYFIRELQPDGEGGSTLILEKEVC